MTPQIEKLAIRGGSPVRSQPFPAGQYGMHVKNRRCWKHFIQVFGEHPVKKTLSTVSRVNFPRLIRQNTDAVFLMAPRPIEVSLRAINIDYGDEVIIPAYTFLATATSCIMVGAIPVFVDIDPNTYNLDPDKIEAALTPRTRAIIPVHIGGNPADMDLIIEIAKKHHLWIIEDACQAHGAAWKASAWAPLEI